MSQKHIEELSFKVKALKANGQVYEDLFNDIQKKVNPNFKKIKAYGNIGDRKNDGFLPDNGSYYQVYAPDDINKERTVVNAVEKLEDDFKGLLKHWNNFVPIKHFKFVLNDKESGCPPPVEQKLAELRNSYPSITFNSYTFDDLLLDYGSLSSEDKQSIVGYIPNLIGLSTVRIPAISDAIDNLKKIVGKTPAPDETYDQAELFTKIEFNKLGSNISNLISNAETQTYLLDEYFSNHSNKRLKSLVRDLLNHIYEEEREKYDLFDDISGPASFFNILSRISVDKTNDSRNASLLLISYFFIACDIYEKPSII